MSHVTGSWVGELKKGKKKAEGKPTESHRITKGKLKEAKGKLKESTRTAKEKPKQS